MYARTQGPCQQHPVLVSLPNKELSIGRMFDSMHELTTCILVWSKPSWRAVRTSASTFSCVFSKYPAILAALAAFWAGLVEDAVGTSKGGGYMASQNCLRNSFAAVWHVVICPKIPSGISLLRFVTSRRATTFCVMATRAASPALRSIFNYRIGEYLPTIRKWHHLPDQVFSPIPSYSHWPLVRQLVYSVSRGPCQASSSLRRCPD